MIDLAADLRLAGVDVVEGNMWQDRGTYLSDATRIEVVNTDTPKADDGLADVERFKESGATAYVQRNGRVWLFGQADAEGVVRVLLACAKTSKLTEAQKDSADVLTALLNAVAFDAPEPDLLPDAE